MVTRTRVYHPELDVGLDVDLSAARVMAASGWRDADETEPEREPEPPPANALKADWIDWAVEQHGLDREEAEALTKAELQDL